jgi:hypothetical protein
VQVTEINFSHIELSAGAQKFIGTFLRFEFALKEDGFCPKRGDALVEWGRVITKLGPTFFETIRKSGKAETILQQPPKKQISLDHRLDWQSQGTPNNIHELFEAIRRVRNNLVHGGKSGDPENDPDNPGRSEILIREAQWIIEQAILYLDNVRSYFEGRY